MSRPRLTEEERIVRWFQSAPPDAAQVLFNILRGMQHDWEASGKRIIALGPSQARRGSKKRAEDESKSQGS